MTIYVNTATRNAVKPRESGKSDVARSDPFCKRAERQPGRSGLLTATTYRHPFLALGVPIDGLAHWRRRERPIGDCLSISVVLGITHFVARSVENRSTLENASTAYCMWRYEKSDKQKKVCLTAGLFPRANRAKQVSGRTQAGGEPRRIPLVGPCWAEGKLGVKGERRDTGPTCANVGQQGASPAERFGLRLGRAEARVSAVEFSEYPERFSARPCDGQVGRRSAERRAENALRIASARSLDDGDDSIAD